jgi:transposase InsO family protein
MSFLLQPWQLLILILAAWINRQQQEAIEYLRTENQVLKEKLGKKRILLSDEQRRRLAVQGKILGRKRLEEVGTLFTPDTILRWHRLLIAKKWDHTDKRKHVGRPRIRQVIVDLILRFAKENPSWGFDRIQGALANVGYSISDTTVGNVLKQHGVPPAPHRKRQTTWTTFIKSHWDVLGAIDFTTVEVWTKSGLVTFYLLFVMELKTRRVHFAGCTPGPDEAWMRQAGRELTAFDDGFLKGKRYLLMDRDKKFCESFRGLLDDEGTKPVRLPPKSPNLNGRVERAILTLRSECLDKFIFFGKQHLDYIVSSFTDYYSLRRAHSSCDSLPPIRELPEEVVSLKMSQIKVRSYVGGLVKSYERKAA